MLMRKRILSLAVLALLVATSCHKSSSTPVCEAISNTAGFKGVNWADERDNYVDGPLVLSGFSASDNYTAIQGKANIVLAGFKNNLGANTVRMPINPQTVLQGWWQSYDGAIDMALSSNMKVILAYWEGAAGKNGLVRDSAQFYAMWRAVINKYGANNNVYFEIFNEPFGYTQSQWQSVCKQWLDTFNYVPRCRILIGGTGYDQNVAVMGADSAFNGCLFSQHAYAFWLPQVNDAQTWFALAQGAVGTYQSRTILTEFGVPMTTGVNYSQPANGNGDIAFMQAMSQLCDSFHMGSCYWPGLRDSDSYSLQILRNDSMITTNASGRQLVQYGWGM
jgi:cellulase (glycosyl hydrolase family 5)